MQAVAGYLKGLREVQGISQTQVAAEVGKRLKRDVQSTTIWRIENAKTTPGGDMLIVLLDMLGGSIKDLATLQDSINGTADDGDRMAREWFDRAAQQATPTELQEVADQLREMADAIASGRAAPPRNGTH